jgi:hypothetical protein
VTFIPATGDNSDVANSYVDLAYASDYQTVRGNTLWAGSDEAKQSALIRATDYIEQVYGQAWIGNTTIIGLSWPRYNTIYDSDVIPDPVKKATCELALEALSGSLSPVTGGTQAVIRKKVDVIEVEYDKAVARKARPAVDGLLRGLLSSSAYNRPVVRV